MKKIVPFIIIFICCLVTVYLWVSSKQDTAIIFEQPLRSISQISALLGTILMAFTVILSTRLKLIELIFGGLDKTYNVHQLLGSISFLLILHHPILLALQSLPQINSALSYLLPSSDLAYSLGAFGLYASIVGFVFMRFIKLPYHIWKISHKLLGIAFLLGSGHVLLIPSDVSNFFPLRLWMGTFVALGIASVVYKFLLYFILGPKYKYQIEKIERSIDVVTIYLKSKKVMNFKPGQFVYVHFKNKSTGKESHPFSIASAPQDNLLRLSAKIVGDYTLKLSQLNEGDKAVVYGPYGRFVMNRFKHKNCLWIAGGIGVTPFLSMLSQEAYYCFANSIYFYYTYRNREEAVFTEEIRDLSQKVPHLRFFDWCSKEKRRLDVKEIMNQVDIRLMDGIFLCGPLAMMEGFKKQFVRVGVPEGKIIYENFSFRT